MERAIQTVEKILRTHLLALEDKVKAKRGTFHLRMAGGVQRRPVQQVSTGQGREDRDAEVEGEALCSAIRGVHTAHHVAGRWKSSRWHMKDWWMSGLHLGKRPGSEENLVMTEEGKVVRARAIKEMHKTLRMEDLDKLMGTPRDPVGILRVAVRDERRGDGLAAPEVEDDSKYLPKKVQITKPIIEQFGPTSGCRKCQAVMSNNKGYQFVHHTTECRDKLTELMRQDERFRRLAEGADERQVRCFAEVLERRD